MDITEDDGRQDIKLKWAKYKETEMVVQYVTKKSLRPDIKDKERPLSKLPFFKSP